jgi:hypothetical protein
MFAGLACCAVLHRMASPELPSVFISASHCQGIFCSTMPPQETTHG